MSTLPGLSHQDRTHECTMKASREGGTSMLQREGRPPQSHGFSCGRKGGTPPIDDNPSPLYAICFVTLLQSLSSNGFSSCLLFYVSYASRSEAVHSSTPLADVLYYRYLSILFYSFIILNAFLLTLFISIKLPCL